MRTTQYKVELYKKVIGNDNEWNSTPIDISDVIETRIRDGIKANADSFSVTLMNSKVDEFNYKYLVAQTAGSGQVQIDIDDRFVVYAWYGEDYNFIEPATHSEKYLFDGFVKEITYQTDANGQRYYHISGVNTSEILLKQLLPARTQITDVNNTAPLIIQEFLNIINSTDVNNKRNVFWSPTNPTLKSDGTEFKKINYIQKYKPVYLMIEELSDEEFTGDSNQYYSYVRTEEVGGNLRNYLYWNIKANTPSGSLVEGKDIFNCKIQRGVWDVINALIINCGRDANGAGIHTFQYDVESYGKIGGRWKYISFEDIAGNILNQEKEQNKSSFTDDSNFPVSYDYEFYISTNKGVTTSAAPNKLIESGQNFIKSVGVGYKVYNTVSGATAKVVSVDGNDTLSLDADIMSNNEGYFIKPVCSNDREFNEALRREAKVQGRKKGDAFIKKHGKARYKLSASLETGSLSYNVGDVITCVVPSYGWSSDNARLLRIQDIQHTIGVNGWETEIQLEEDYKIATMEAQGAQSI